MPSIEVGSQTLNYEDSGGSGPVVLFSHGLTMTGAMFSPQRKAFDNRYRCITWDQRGHGQSPASGPFTLWDSARDALVLLDRLEIDRAIFVGSSQGGFVSLRAALLAPERVHGLGVMGTSAASEDPMQKAAHEQLHTALFSAAVPPEALLDMVIQSFFGQGFDPGPWREHLRGLPKEQATFSFRAAVDRDEVVNKLNRITAPTLVLHGSADPIYAPSHGKQIANGVANCRGYVLVENGSHFLSMTHPEPTNVALGDFFEALA